MVYIYASRWILPQSPSGRLRQRAQRAGQTVKVGIAGASGFAGQELLRWLAGPPARARYGGDVVVAGRPGANAARAGEDLGRRHRAVLGRQARRASPTSCFWRLPEDAAAAIAPALVERGIRVIDLSGAFRLRDAAAREKWYPATKLGALKPVYGLTERELRRHRRRRAHYEPRLLSHRRAAGARAAGRDRAAGRRGRHRRKVGHLGSRQEAERPDALFGKPRQRVGLRRLRPPASARNRAGARRAGHVRAAPRPARSRHSRNDLRPGAAGHDIARRGRSDGERPTRTRHSCGSRAKRCRRSSTRRTRTSAISAGAWTRQGAASFLWLSSTTSSRGRRARPSRT